MANSGTCKQNTDPLKLVHEGTRQDQRFSAPLSPAYAPIDERRLEHALVFAKAYAGHLKFYDANNIVTGDWSPFFSRDVSAQLAIVAVQDIDYYKSSVKASFDFLNNLGNDKPDKETELKQHLGYLFSLIGTLARQLEQLKAELAPETPLKHTLRSLIRNQLAPALARLIAYHEAFPKSDSDFASAHPNRVVLGAAARAFGDVYTYAFSKDWITTSDSDWTAYVSGIAPDSSVYGSGAGVFERINHLATHNLFKSVFDQFLKVYVRTVTEARQALQQTLTGRDDHEPHYALFLAFLRLLDHARAETNTLTARHLDFYYRQILRLKEKPAEPGHVHLLAELARQADSHEIAAGALFKAGKDDAGVDVVYANDRTFVANRSKVAALKSVYRHADAPHDSLPHQNGRLFASPIADSDDGLGAKLTSADQSWQPFFNKRYSQGELAEIRMPGAEIGFAVASHYLLLAEGVRTITLRFAIDPAGTLNADHKADVACFLSSEKGWFQAEVTEFASPANGQLRLTVRLGGGDPSVMPYSAKKHGYRFETDLPVLLLKLAHNENSDFLYAGLEAIRVQKIDLDVAVSSLRTLALANDFGPVDASKPFQPFGTSPATRSSLVIGSREAFQKKLSSCTIRLDWQTAPAPYPGATVKIGVDFLQNGQWSAVDALSFDIDETEFELLSGIASDVKPYVDKPDLSEPAMFSTASRHGYVRLKLSGDFGQSLYEQALATYINNVINQDATDPKPVPLAGPFITELTLDYTAINNVINRVTLNPKPVPPAGPFITELTLDYTATQTLLTGSSQQTGFDARPGRFFHLAPFGHAEQHPLLKSGGADPSLHLLPQFRHLNSAGGNGFDKKLPANHPVRHEAECYIGIADLRPPQNLALLFQIADGTADPVSVKPEPHIHWSYLRDNEWTGFPENTVQDGTSGLLNSGIITFSVPDDASSANTLLPAGQHWIRAAVAAESDAICRLQMVAAQGLSATFKDTGNDPAFAAQTLPAGTISKLDTSRAAVKGVSQPFPGFGGKGAERADAFYTRVSERLRHKDRAIALWDYEHLLLETFPQIYQAKCLNHTHYEPDEDGGIYRELAPGHVTIVTVPNQQFHNLRDPLRPYTSLGLLEDIKAFLRQRLSCFVKLHVKNPLFEEVGAQFKVRFHPRFDETFHAAKLDEAITRFLSPWAFPGGGSPTFGGKVYQSVLINFVEEQPYVDYVTDFRLSHTYTKLDGNGQKIEVVDQDVAEIEGSKAVSILVSARHHAIEVINPAQQTTVDSTCPCESV